MTTILAWREGQVWLFTSFTYFWAWSVIILTKRVSLFVQGTSSTSSLTFACFLRILIIIYTTFLLEAVSPNKENNLHVHKQKHQKMIDNPIHKVYIKTSTRPLKYILGQSLTKTLPKIRFWLQLFASQYGSSNHQFYKSTYVHVIGEN